MMDRENIETNGAALVPAKRARRRPVEQFPNGSTPYWKKNRALDKQVRRLTNDLRKIAPRLDDMAYMPILKSFARLTLLSQHLYGELRDRQKNGGLIDADGNAPSAIGHFRLLVIEQRNFALDLGLSPSARDRLATPTTATMTLDLDSMRSAADAETRPAKQNGKRIKRSGKIQRSNVRRAVVVDAETDPESDRD